MTQYFDDYHSRENNDDYENDGTSGDGDEDERDSFGEEFEYEPEQLSLTKNNIILCDLYDDIPKMNSCHLVHIRFKKFDYNQITNMYRNLIVQKPTCRLEIAECIYVPSGHCIAVLKTFWIKIIQRAWKRVFNQRRAYSNLRLREVRPLQRLNGLRGLLSSLVR